MMDTSIDKLCSKPAEAATLASMILDPGCISEVIRVVCEDDFFTEAHRTIFQAIVAVWEQSPDLDGLLVRDWLANRGLLEKIGGIQYLQAVLDSIPTACNHAHYSKIVADRRRYREAAHAVAEMQQSLEGGTDVGEQIREIQQTALSLSSEQPKTVYSTAQYATDVALAAQEAPKTIPTGLRNLDGIIGGLGPGELVIVAGRPSMGKSALASQVALNMASHGKSILYFTLEMSGPSLIERLISQHSGVCPGSLRHDPGQHIIDRWHKASLELGRMNITVIEGHETVAQQTAFLRSCKLRHEVSAVFVDYLQLMRAKGQSRYEQVTAISRDLKLMALAEGVPVVALSQLNRACEGRSDHRPQMGDLRESGGIEQDADVIVLLHREDYYRRQEQGSEYIPDGSAEAIVAKNRRGAVGVGNLVFIDECFGFGDRSRGLAG